MCILFKPAEVYRLRSELEVANEEIIRLRTRLDTSESDLLVYKSASNISHSAGSSCYQSNLNGLHAMSNYIDFQRIVIAFPCITRRCGS
jgi:hypothetical protein